MVRCRGISGTRSRSTPRPVRRHGDGDCRHGLQVDALAARGFTRGVQSGKISLSDTKVGASITVRLSGRSRAFVSDNKKAPCGNGLLFALGASMIRKLSDDTLQRLRDGPAHGRFSPWRPPTCPVLPLLGTASAQALATEYQNCKRLHGGGFCGPCMTDVVPYADVPPARKASPSPRLVQQEQHDDVATLFGNG